MRPVSFDPKVIRKKHVGAIGDGQCLRIVFCEQEVPCHTLELTRRLLAGLAVTFCLNGLDFCCKRLRKAGLTHPMMADIEKELGHKK